METDDPYTYKNAQSEFVLEDDSIDIIYNFHGENAPITVGVYNKMSKPVYIDWRKSGIIIDNHSNTYREPLDAYAAQGDTGTVDYGRFLNDPEGLGFVKPGSRLNTQVLELANFNFHKIPEDKFTSEYKETHFDNFERKFKRIFYTWEDSPIYIQTFLTVYEKANDMSDPLYYENEFYMSQLIRGGKTSPSHVKAFKEGNGNIFFVKKEKGTFWKKAGNTSLKILGGVAVVTGNIVVWALEGSDVYE